jgi:hypothetical protein
MPCFAIHNTIHSTEQRIHSIEKPGLVFFQVRKPVVLKTPTEMISNALL